MLSDAKGDQVNEREEVCQDTHPGIPIQGSK